MYADGVRQAAIETGLPESAFPAASEYSLARIEHQLILGDEAGE